ncbi:hypothetical protein Ancab_004634 [Ancistrocladus abbreviatus]
MEHDLEEEYHDQLSHSAYDIDDDDDHDNISHHLDSYERERAGQGGEEEPLPLLMSSNIDKVMIQLRIPKREESSSSSSAWHLSSSSSMAMGNGHINDDDKKQQKVEKRICSICNKRFSSGKALGGHMRVHVQLRRFGDLKEIPTRKRNKFPWKVKKSLVAAGEHSKRKRRYYAGNSNNNNYNFRDLIMQNGKPTCSLCNKSFPSQKSLFGHMRCHPDRGWRGMLPPSHLAAKNSSSSTVSDATPRAIQMEDHFDSAATTPANSAAAAVTALPQTAIDLPQLIPGWSITAKRGRKSLISSSLASEEENNQIQDNAVVGLMLLANSGERNFNSLSSHSSHKIKKKVKLEVDCEARSNCRWEEEEIGDKGRLCDFYISLKKKKMKQRQLEPTATGENWSNCPPSRKLRIEERAFSAAAAAVTLALGLTRPEEMVNSESSKFVMEEEDVGFRVEVDGEKNDNEMMNGKKRRKRRMMKLRDLELQLEEVEVEEEVLGRERKGEEEKYRCATCNKCFPTHQALGGHRSSHYKFKNYYFMEDPAAAPATAPAFAAASTQEVHVEEETVAASAFAAAGLTSSSAAAAIHLCRICNKSFPSGQALGGHKRCHWTGEGSSVAESSPVAGDAGSSSRPVERRILSFDLNELPAAEEAEEDAAENKSTFS